MPAQAALTDSPKMLVDQAWQIVQRNYVDRTFNQQDWTAVRQQYLDAAYPSKAAAFTAIQRMLTSLQDPYTRFLSPAELKDLTQNVSGGFIGVGLTVTIDPQTREWIVEEAFPESPAANAGIQAQDIIVSLNNKPTATIRPEEATPYLVGPVGSKLTVQVRRQQQQITHELVREQINLNPLTYRAIKTTTGTIGYIRLPVFTTKSAAAMQTALTDLEAQGVGGYLLDLRGNPGGVLEASVQIAEQLLNTGTIVLIQERDRPQEKLQANGRALTQRPLVVLVDQDSASASEVLAAALQDNHRAAIVGTQTFGKGLVQSFEPLAEGAGVLVTIARYLTPRGQTIHQTGIQPDVPVNATGTDQSTAATDPQYLTALRTLNRIITQAASPTTGKGLLR